MNQALLLNIAIVAAIIVCLVVLQNPLALFGLLLLKEMSYGLSASSQEDSESVETDEGSSIGFV
jgi:preprotein translocase subunit SecG